MVRAAVRLELDRRAAANPPIEAYLADLRTRCSARHVENVERALRRLRDESGGYDPQSILAYRERRLRAGASYRTCNLEVGALKACFAWAEAIGLVAHHPLRGVRALPQREADLRKRRRALTDEEVDRFLQAARELDARHDTRLAWLWTFLLETGARWNEAVTLRQADVLRGLVTIRSANAKGRRGRKIPISPALALAISKSPTDDPIFRDPKGRPWTRDRHRLARDWFLRTLARARIELVDADHRGLDIHALRVTACTRMLRRGVALEAVAKILGHRDVRLTARVYADLGVEDLRREAAKGW